MKPTPLLLAASLIANVGLVAVVVTRPAGSPAPKSTSSTTSSSGESEATRRADALRAALASGDATALAAAGVSPEIARELIIGRTFARMAEKLRASRTKAAADEKWWRSRPGMTSASSREQQLVARRELSDALIAAFGDDLGFGGVDQSQLAFLPEAKRDALRRINQDYDEMMAKFGAGGVQLPSDREKLRLLRLERERDIAALLTPEERLAYEMRTSMSGNIVRGRYAIPLDQHASKRHGVFDHAARGRTGLSAAGRWPERVSAPAGRRRATRSPAPVRVQCQHGGGRSRDQRHVCRRSEHRDELRGGRGSRRGSSSERTSPPDDRLTRAAGSGCARSFNPSPGRSYTSPLTLAP